MRAHPRGPASEPVPGALPPVVDTTGGVVRITSTRAPRRLTPDTVPPGTPVQVLWLQGRGAVAGPANALVLDDAGQLLVVDDRLRAVRPMLGLEGRVIASVAPGPAKGLWFTDTRGMLLMVDSTGRLVKEDSTAFAFPVVAGTPDGARTYVVRSAQRFAYRWPDPSAPLIASLANGTQHGLGQISVPEQGILAELNNAGHVATDGARIFYAPFIRDEVLALSPAGDTLWVLRRQLPQSTREVRFELADGAAVINYHPVNLGLVMGPGGRLYVLSTPGFTMEASRLDQIDPATGLLVATAEFATATPTVAADADGRVYLLDGAGLVSGSGGLPRDAFRHFELPLLDGGTLSSTELRGSVALVNFWASWCGPCRAEMPALDSIARDFAGQGLRYASLNDEHDHDAARRFLAEVGLSMPVAMGDGRLQAEYHLPGLPVTLLLDRQGRVAGRWIGGLTEQQLPALRSAIRAELARGSQAQPASGTAHHH
jgi:thiol-disulfide isomerase/thioredoxin